ncbi:epimerase [Flavobacterium sp. RHBU_3]|uniref:epimerase n=1 Tax=Flavobacterium sp. RHBU_3 TaxID=3391184 RepID=UPI0039855832
MALKVIITGVTGMVGEGVLLDCLQNEKVSEILIIGRKAYRLQHPKVTELIVPDFFSLDAHADTITGYDACLFCAGISSAGMSEEKYTYITYDTTLAFAHSALKVNPNMTFNYISGLYTDGSEKGRIMWARVKGRTENALTKLPFKGVYNFRPGGMLPVKGQKNSKALYKGIVLIIKLFSPKSILTLTELGRAMVNVSLLGYEKPVLEISDIKLMAKD